MAGLTNAGRNFIAQAIANLGSPDHFDAANAHIGVGDSSTAFAVGQTDLQAASNKLRRGMEGGYPQLAANIATFRSLFGTSDANHAWNEWGLFNAASDGVMLARIVESLGTKSSAQSWQLTTALALVLPAIGSLWPDSTNTGHLNEPNYPGSLTPYAGPDPITTGNQTFEYIDFDGITVQADNITFRGCRFRSNWNDGWNIRIDTTGTTGVRFEYCTIEPSAVVAPPVVEWPSAGLDDGWLDPNDTAYMIDYDDAYQYGIICIDGALEVDHCDIWGFGNAIVLFGADQKTITNNWIHDASAEGDAVQYHQDGPGHLDGTGCSNVLIDGNTIASIGNTNAIAFQAGVYDNLVVTNNYLSGFSYCVDIGHGNGSNTNLEFSGNVLATDIGWVLGPLYTNFSSNFTPSTWFNNTLRVHPGSEPRGTASFSFDGSDDGKFLHPDGTLSAVDWAG